jgi:hypothetical protein
MKLLHLFTAAMTAFKELQRSNVYDVGCPLWAALCLPPTDLEAVICCFDHLWMRKYRKLLFSKQNCHLQYYAR